MTKEHALSDEHIEYNYPYVKYYILLIFDLTETNIYTCKYCTGLWISWYKGEIKRGKTNTATVYY